MLVASAQGGVDIEGVAAETPDAIITVPVDINKGLDAETARALAAKLGFSKKSVDSAADVFQKLYKLFIDKDATMVEINPMAESSTGEGACCPIDDDDL
jgi:succinyl-CoA synthetase beta subunit